MALLDLVKNISKKAVEAKKKQEKINSGPQLEKVLQIVSESALNKGNTQMANKSLDLLQKIKAQNAPQLGTLTPEQSIKGTAKMEAFEQQPLQMLKKAPFLQQSTSKYNPEVQGTAPFTKQVVNPTFAPFTEFAGGVLGGIKQAIAPSESTLNPIGPNVPSSKLSGQTQLSNSVKPLSVLDRFTRGFISNVPSLGGTGQIVEDKDLDETIKFIAPVLFQPSAIKQGIQKMLPSLEKTVFYKNQLVPGNQIKQALQELTSGVKTGTNPQALQAAQELISLNSKGAEIFKAVSEGANIKVKRDFVSWAQRVLNLKTTKSPEVQAFLAEIKQTAPETMSMAQIDKYYQQGLSIFKPSRMVGLKGTEGGASRPGIETPAPLPKPQETKTPTSASLGQDLGAIRPSPKEITTPSSVSTDRIQYKDAPIKNVGISKVGKSIESKSVEKKLTDAFDGTAEYDIITIKGQAKQATDLINRDILKAKSVLSGIEPLPDGLRGSSLITALEDYAIKNGDAQLLKEIARSPLTSETSIHAQEMRLLAERNPDSPVAAIQAIKKIREAKAQRVLGGKKVKEARSEIVKDIKNEIKRVAPTKETWASFIDSITC